MSTNSNISYGPNFFIFIILVILAHEGVSAYTYRQMYMYTCKLSIMGLAIEAINRQPLST